MTTVRTAAHAPWLVRAPNRLVRWLLAKGAPMGPNVAMTVLGRTTGEPRTLPVAVSTTLVPLRKLPIAMKRSSPLNARLSVGAVR